MQSTFEAKFESRAVAFQLYSSATQLYYTNVKYNQEEKLGSRNRRRAGRATSLHRGGRYLAFN